MRKWYKINNYDLDLMIVFLNFFCFTKIKNYKISVDV